MPFVHTVARFAPCAFGEYDVIAAILHLLCYRLYDGDALTCIRTVEGVGLGNGKQLLEQRDVFELLLVDERHRVGAGGGYGHHVKQTLMVAVEHKSVLLGDVLKTRHGQFYVGSTHDLVQYAADIVPYLLAGVLIGPACKFFQLYVCANDRKQVFGHHECDAVHVISLSKGDWQGNASIYVTARSFGSCPQ